MYAGLATKAQCARCLPPTPGFTLCHLNAQANGVNGSTSPGRITHHHRRQAPLLAEQRPARGPESRATALGHVEWGYCKIDGALSPDQVAVIRQRVLDR